MKTEQKTSEAPNFGEENQDDLQSFQQNATEENCVITEDKQSQQTVIEQKTFKINDQEDRSSFVHGLSAGIGIGCIATFVIVWVSIFFTPMLPTTVTYEALLSIFVYPLVYLLAVGLITLTAGMVREYYAKKYSRKR